MISTMNLLEYVDGVDGLLMSHQHNKLHFHEIAFVHNKWVENMAFEDCANEVVKKRMGIK